MLGRLLRIKSNWDAAQRCRRALKIVESNPRPLKLHIGCGQIHFPGWIHLDADSSLPHLDAVWHAADRLPCEDGACDFIYNEHFLEHLSVKEGAYFLSECRRVLSPKGVLRIGMPDMNEFVRQYWEQDWDHQPWLKKYGYTWIANRCELLNIVFREWGHLWLYDREELHRRLTDAGFKSIRDVEPNQSAYAELQNRESRLETTLICEAS